MMRPTPLYAPDGMASGARYHDRFDDGLVHNHHWAVTTDEAYPAHIQGSPIEWTDASGFISRREAVRHADDRHDDGLVHNHEWAVTSK